ncbi:c-type cytochrome [Thioalkalivibrio sp.]|uniref:c-type cytochrome n=1 Tax=Thioalkalivibrio sp. TaxID=2093813 RepID=UPI003563B693
MKMYLIIAAGAIAMSAGANLQAADLEAGAATYQTCISCHGPAAQGQAIFPALAGRDAEYLADKLQRYRAGEQVGENTALMAPHATGLSDEEIENVSAYIAEEFD